MFRPCGKRQGAARQLSRSCLCGILLTVLLLGLGSCVTRAWQFVLQPRAFNGSVVEGLQQIFGGLAVPKPRAQAQAPCALSFEAASNTNLEEGATEPLDSEAACACVCVSKCLFVRLRACLLSCFLLFVCVFVCFKPCRP